MTTTAGPAPAAIASGRSNRAVWTYASSLILGIVTMATGLMATPLLKQWLGTARFGAVRTLADLAGYLGLLELGLGSALAPLLARALSQGDERALRQNVAAGTRAYTVIVAVVLAFGLVLLGPIGRLARAQPQLGTELRVAWLVSLAAWASLVLNPFRTVTEAENRGYRVNLVLVGQTLLVTALALLLARLGWGLVGQSLALTVGVILGSVMLAALAIRARPGLARAVFTERVDPEVRRALWRIGWPTLLFRLSGQISLMTDYLVISAIKDVSFVTPLYLTQRLTVLAQQQVQNVGTAAWAPLVALHYRGEHGQFNRRLVELTGLVSLLAFAALGPILAYNHHFIALWVGSASDAGDLVVLIAAINALLQGLFSLWTYGLVGVGQVGRLVWPSLIGAAVNLAASLALTQRLGLLGPLLGTLVGFVALNAWFLPWRLWRSFGIRPRDLAAAVGRVAILGVPATAALWWSARDRTPWGWTGLAVEMTAAALAILLLGARLTFNAEQRAVWRARLRAALPGSIRS